jgi:hypothetical protein
MADAGMSSEVARSGPWKSWQEAYVRAAEGTTRIQASPSRETHHRGTRNGLVSNEGRLPHEAVAN